MTRVKGALKAGLQNMLISLAAAVLVQAAILLTFVFMKGGFGIF